MTITERSAVLLLAHGTPGTLSDIPEYLSNVTSGRPLTQAAIDEITHRYSLIGKSPITDITFGFSGSFMSSTTMPLSAAI